MNTHQASCNWAKTTPEECEYRNTHHYCPHDEHACTCPPMQDEKRLECKHELHEKETACADGMCPMCLATELQTLAREKDAAVKVGDDFKKAWEELSKENAELKAFKSSVETGEWATAHHVLVRERDQLRSSVGKLRKALFHIRERHKLLEPNGHSGVEEICQDCIYGKVADDALADTKGMEKSK